MKCTVFDNISRIDETFDMEGENSLSPEIIKAILCRLSTFSDNEFVFVSLTFQRETLEGRIDFDFVPVDKV